jgi:hypothetical protein
MQGGIYKVDFDSIIVNQWTTGSSMLCSVCNSRVVKDLKPSSPK